MSENEQETPGQWLGRQYEEQAASGAGQATDVSGVPGWPVLDEVGYVLRHCAAPSGYDLAVASEKVADGSLQVDQVVDELLGEAAGWLDWLRAAPSQIVAEALTLPEVRA